MSAALSHSAALDAAAGIIAKSVPDLAHLAELLAELLDAVGQARLAAALRARLGDRRDVGARPKIDPKLWAIAGRGWDWRGRW